VNLTFGLQKEEIRQSFPFEEGKEEEEEDEERVGRFRMTLFSFSPSIIRFLASSSSRRASLTSPSVFLGVLGGGGRLDVSVFVCVVSSGSAPDNKKNITFKGSAVPDRGFQKDKDTILSIKNATYFLLNLHGGPSNTKRSLKPLRKSIQLLKKLHFSFSVGSCVAFLDPSLDKRINEYEFPTLYMRNLSLYVRNCSTLYMGNLF
jgi:hypothetical protein